MTRLFFGNLMMLCTVYVIAAFFVPPMRDALGIVGALWCVALISWLVADAAADRRMRAGR